MLSPASIEAGREFMRLRTLHARGPGRFTEADVHALVEITDILGDELSAVRAVLGTARYREIVESAAARSSARTALADACAERDEARAAARALLDVVIVAQRNDDDLPAVAVRVLRELPEWVWSESGQMADATGREQPAPADSEVGLPSKTDVARASRAVSQQVDTRKVTLAAVAEEVAQLTRIVAGRRAAAGLDGLPQRIILDLAELLTAAGRAVPEAPE